MEDEKLASLGVSFCREVDDFVECETLVADVLILDISELKSFLIFFIFCKMHGKSVGFVEFNLNLRLF